jgi:opacity protein-like surface antigen
MNRLFLGLLVLGATGTAAAADQSPWYVGADYGVAGNFSQDGGNRRFYLGYRLGSVQAAGMELINAVEAQLYKFQFNNYATGKGGYAQHQNIRVDGGGLTWAPELKFNESVALNGRLGVGYNHSNVQVVDSTSSQNYSRVAPLGSLGASYALNEYVKLRADVSYTQVGTGARETSDHTMLTTGLQLNF